MQCPLGYIMLCNLSVCQRASITEAPFLKNMILAPKNHRLAYNKGFGETN